MFTLRNVVFPLLGIFMGFAGAGPLSAAPLSNEGFVIFDGLLYQGKPDLGPLGIVRIGGVNPSAKELGATAEVDPQDVRATLHPILGRKGFVYLDYEQWAVSGLPDDRLSENIHKLAQVADIARETVPDVKFGYYGLIPCFDYYNVISGDPAKIARWQNCNARLDELAKHVDVVMPSLYAFVNDQQAWDKFASAQLQAARRYGKPVYAFLWPEFHPSNVKLKGTNIPAQFWRHQLEFCKTHADGVILWGGWQKKWDEGAPWWVETKAFMETLKKP